LKIAILGALGFLGKELSLSLTNQGHQVTGFVLNQPSVQPEGFICRPISSLKVWGTSPEDDFDVVINLAARRSTKSNPLSEAKVREFTFNIPKDFILKASGAGTLILNTSTYIQNFELSIRLERPRRTTFAIFGKVPVAGDHGGHHFPFCYRVERPAAWSGKIGSAVVVGWARSKELTYY
jgi:hypothetical protein